MGFLFLFLYFICNKLCPRARIAIFFPHFEYHRSTKESLLKFFIFFFAILALSSPYSIKNIIQIDKGDAIVLSIDSSGSMQEFNKFDVVKKVADEFISKRVNDKIGLVVFGSNSFIASPLTKDNKFVRDILSKMYVGIAGENTAIYDSLLQSIRLLKNTTAKSKIIILLTDGVDNSSKISIIDAVKELQKYKIKVYTIGIGHADDAVLRYIAINTNGKMYKAESVEDIKTIYNEIDKLEKTDIKHKIVYKEYLYIYPLLLAISLLLWYVRKERW